MGVRGLTSFISKNSDRYLSNYKLQNTYLVVDGNNLAIQLYIWHCKAYDCFGGDYDKYMKTVLDFFQVLEACSVTPLVIFDGSYENRKLKTIFKRFRDRIKLIQKLDSRTEGFVKVFPLFIRHLFVSILKKLNVKIVRCELEADNEIANVARYLNCPVLSYDSDFFIFDVPYVPFSTMELRTVLDKKSKLKYIPCQIYTLDKFLQSFGGLEKSTLPLLAVLLGNDYVKVSTFNKFYSQIKLEKRKFAKSKQQQRIVALIKWLQTETFESAVNKVLSRSKIKYRKFLLEQIMQASNGYHFFKSEILRYLDINVPVDYKTNQLVAVNGVDNIEDNCCKESETETSESSLSDDSDVESDDDINDINKVIENDNAEELPLFFRDKYFKCDYPSDFMNIATGKIFFIQPQLENFSNVNSHKISEDIMIALHTILTSGKIETMRYVARGENASLKVYYLNKSEKSLPKLEELRSLKQLDAKLLLLNILEIKSDVMEHLGKFPSSWSLLLLCIDYWSRKASPAISNAHIYALILSLITLYVVDKKIGQHRSVKVFFKNFEKKIKALNPAQTCFHEDISESIKAINIYDCYMFVKKLIYNFHMEEKLLMNRHKTYCIETIDVFAQFQSCYLHIMYLNDLLNNPFENLLISEFYNGTFIYNLCNNFLKRTDLENYLSMLLAEAPSVLNLSKLTLNAIMLRLNLQKTVKRSRRRKKNKKVENKIVIDVCEEEISDEAIFDINNKFSLLSSC